MTEKIFLSIVSIIMAYRVLNQQGLFNKIITGGLMFGILLTWFSSTLFVTIGFLVYSIATLLVIIYSFTEKHLSKLDSGIIFTTGLIVLIRKIGMVMHMKYANEITLLMIIPVIGFVLFSFISKENSKKENSFMTILAVDCLLVFIGYWNRL